MFNDLLNQIAFHSPYLAWTNEERWYYCFLLSALMLCFWIAFPRGGGKS